MIEKVVDATIMGIIRGGWDYGTAAQDLNKLLMRLKVPQDSCLGANCRNNQMEDLFLLADISEAHDYAVGDVIRITIQNVPSAA